MLTTLLTIVKHVVYYFYMVDKIHNLITYIESYLTHRGISGGSFSRQLQVDPSTWSYIKSGTKRPGAKFLSAVVANYPDLRDAVFKYMTDEANHAGN